MDGAVYEWEVATSKRLHEAVLKACGYTGLGLNADAKTVFAVGTDRKIKEIVDAQVSCFVIISIDIINSSFLANSSRNSGNTG
jgi:hypothetical protein